MILWNVFLLILNGVSVYNVILEISLQQGITILLFPAGKLNKLNQLFMAGYNLFFTPR